MKKITALVIAALLIFAAVPALAFTGFEADPGMPEITVVENELIPVEVKRVENDPEESENEWGETVYTWIYMDNSTAVEPGEDVTLSCEIAVPEVLEGYDEEALSAIEIRISFEGLDVNELVWANGCDANYECDYDLGMCFQLPGYGNAALDGEELVVDAHLNTEPQVIVRGIAAADKIVCTCTVTIGQYDVPTHFSVGKLTCEGETYYAYIKDIFNVQIRGMKFVASEGVFDHYYVCLNNHDYIRSNELRGVIYTEVGNEENVITEGPKFEALERAYNDYMGFFGFTDDEIADVLTPGVFIAGSEPVRSAKEIVFGSEGEPVPVDPTEEPVPVDPTDVPAPIEPPAPPATGAVSLAVLGAAAVIAGAGVAVFRRKNDR